MDIQSAHLNKTLTLALVFGATLKTFGATVYSQSGENVIFIELAISKGSAERWKDSGFPYSLMLEVFSIFQTENSSWIIFKSIVIFFSTFLM